MVFGQKILQICRRQLWWKLDRALMSVFVTLQHSLPCSSLNLWNAVFALAKKKCISTKNCSLKNVKIVRGQLSFEPIRTFLSRRKHICVQPSLLTFMRVRDSETWLAKMVCSTWYTRERYYKHMYTSRVFIFSPLKFHNLLYLKHMHAWLIYCRESNFFALFKTEWMS